MISNNENSKDNDNNLVLRQIKGYIRKWRKVNYSDFCDIKMTEQVCELELEGYLRAPNEFENVIEFSVDCEERIPNTIDYPCELELESYLRAPNEFENVIEFSVDCEERKRVKNLFPCGEKVLNMFGSEQKEPTLTQIKDENKINKKYIKDCIVESNKSPLKVKHIRHSNIEKVLQKNNPENETKINVYFSLNNERDIRFICPSSLTVKKLLSEFKKKATKRGICNAETVYLFTFDCKNVEKMADKKLREVGISNGSKIRVVCRNNCFKKGEEETEKSDIKTKREEGEYGVRKSFK